MLIINGTTQIQTQGNIFERLYDIRGEKRKVIEIHIPKQEGVNYNLIANIFTDGAQIINQERTTHIEQKLIKESTENTEAEYENVEIETVKDYPLTEFVVAGDIIDKRDGSFVVYMGLKTESEIMNEEMAELLLMVGGTE